MSNKLGINGIGKLEAEIMDCIWLLDSQEITVRDVYEHLRKKKQIAYTTIMTVMTNLSKKDLLIQHKSGSRNTAYLYDSPISRTELANLLLIPIEEIILNTTDFKARII